MMNMQANKPPYLPLLGAGSAALLLGGIAIASLAISAQGSSAALEPAAQREAAATPADVPRWCAECGVIESAQRIEAADASAAGNRPGQLAPGGARDGTTPGNYAITIRLRDGSTRVVTDAHPARWRPGERVTLIAGMQQRAQ